MGTVGTRPDAAPSRPETVLVGTGAGTDDNIGSARRRVPFRASTIAGIFVLVGVAIALRVWVLRSPVGRADSDEAVVALMARAILHGHHPTFFWGQPYGGTLEPGLV